MIRLTVATLLLLTGCDMQRVTCKTDPPDVHIAPECVSACNLELPILTDDPNSIVDAAATERAALKQCDAKRKLCVAALQRAKDAGAIK